MDIKRPDSTSAGLQQGPQSSRQAADSAGGTARRSATAGHSAAAGGESGDKVTLTGVAQRLLELASVETDRGAPVDQARVDAIREALANGTYEIEHERIIERLLSFDRS